MTRPHLTILLLPSLAFLAQMVGEVYAAFTTNGIQQDILATGILGGLVVKTATSFLVNTIIAGLLIKPFLRWARGDKRVPVSGG